MSQPERGDPGDEVRRLRTEVDAARERLAEVEHRAGILEHRVSSLLRRLHESDTEEAPDPPPEGIRGALRRIQRPLSRDRAEAEGSRGEGLRDRLDDERLPATIARIDPEADDSVEAFGLLATRTVILVDGTVDEDLARELARDAEAGCVTVYSAAHVPRRLWVDPVAGPMLVHDDAAVGPLIGDVGVMVIDRPVPLEALGEAASVAEAQILLHLAGVAVNVDRVEGPAAGALPSPGRLRDLAGPALWRWSLCARLTGGEDHRDHPVRVAVHAGAEALLGRDWPGCEVRNVTHVSPTIPPADVLVLGPDPPPRHAVPPEVVTMVVGHPSTDLPPRGHDLALEFDEDPHEVLLSYVRRPRAAICIGAPSPRVAERWGDTHFAAALSRALQRCGLPTRVLTMKDWEAPHGARDDVRIHLFGMSWLSPRPSQLDVLWIISHPDLVDEHAAGYDLVYAASETLAKELSRSLGREVGTLRQATDTSRFAETPGGRPHEVLFVGNTRGAARPIVLDAVAVGAPLAIYGSGWGRTEIPPELHVADHVANEDLPALYTAAGVVLNDHWDDMRRWGIVSNRILDVLATGTPVISDDIELPPELASCVLRCRTAEDLSRALAEAADPDRAAELGARGREIVRSDYSFDGRARELVESILPRLSVGVSRCQPGPTPTHATAPPTA